MVETSAYSRTLAEAATDPSGNVLAEAGAEVGDVLIDQLFDAGVKSIRVRSVLTCEVAGAGPAQLLRTFDGRPASWSTSVRPWASSPHSPSVSPARS